MEPIVWFGFLGALLFLIWLRPSKAHVERRASDEFADFVNAIGHWNVDRSNVPARHCALSHFSLYERRLGDLGDKTVGVSIPRERVLLATLWMEHLFKAGLLDGVGGPCQASTSGRDFWETLAALRSEQNRSRPTTPDLDAWVGTRHSKPVGGTQGITAT